MFNAVRGNATDAVRLVTYNVRRSGKEQSPQNLWANRKPLVFDIINTMHPDVIGFQEVVQDQFDDLRTVLADYDSFGEPRSTKTSGWWQRMVMKHPRATDEHNPIFYNKKRIALLASGNFGINPRGGRFHIMTADLPRLCTWGLFEDKKTGARFYVYNTHLDNSWRRVRSRQISQIMKHVKKNTKGMPVIFMGDLNTPLKGKKKNKKIAKVGFVHARAIAQQVVGPQETRTGWNNSELKTIDHIFVKGQKPVVKKYEVVTSPEGVFPSDHRPVLVDVVLVE
jgi:endonuclease/exonuclease/phosphatase family metal-dependent hydrolase